MPARKAERLAQQGADIIEIAEIARRINRSETTIRKRIRDGQFPGYFDGTTYDVPRVMYEQWLRGDWRSPRQKEQEAA